MAILPPLPSLPLVLVTLGIIGIWRWGLWLLRTLAAAFLYDPVTGDPPDLDVSVVVPVYEEDPEGFAAALDSWAANDPAEIVAVVDASDDACIAVFESFAAGNDAANLVVTDVPGKRAALRRGVRETTGDVLALVDSDVHWEPDTKGRFLVPFDDPDVGGVAPKQVVAEQDTLARRLYEASQRIRFATDVPALSATAGALSVVSGRTAVYRREAAVDALDNIETETFRRQTVISGEDKFLTRLVHATGWDTRYQSTSVVRIAGARSLGTLLRQSVRWRRNTFRSDFRSLSSRWVYERPALAYHMIDRFFSPFAALLAPTYMVGLLLQGFSVVPARTSVADAWTLSGLLVGWWVLSRTLKLHPYLGEYGRFDIVPAYIPWTFVLIPVNVFSMLTATNQGWMTRGTDSRYARTVGPWHNRLVSLASAVVVALVIGLYVFLVLRAR